TRIYVLDRMFDEQGRPASFDLGQDLTILAEQVRLIGDVALIVIDPITAYLGAGKIDTHKTADVRAVLSPVKDFADEHGVAVLGPALRSRSLPRAGTAARGSGALAAAARATGLSTREHGEDGQEPGPPVMRAVKTTLPARRNNGMAYRIASHDLG